MSPLDGAALTGQVASVGGGPQSTDAEKQMNWPLEHSQVVRKLMSSLSLDPGHAKASYRQVLVGSKEKSQESPAPGWVSGQKISIVSASPTSSTIIGGSVGSSQKEKLEEQRNSPPSQVQLVVKTPGLVAPGQPEGL